MSSQTQTANTTLETDISYMKQYFPFLLPDEPTETVQSNDFSENEEFLGQKFDENGVEIIQARSANEIENLFKVRISKLRDFLTFKLKENLKQALDEKTEDFDVEIKELVKESKNLRQTKRRSAILEDNCRRLQETHQEKLHW